MGTPLDERTGPWRVVIECPTPVGEPPAQHRVVFTGTGDHEPAEVLGTPAVGWDLALEDAASVDLAPPTPSHRAERRLKVVLIAEMAIAALARRASHGPRARSRRPCARRRAGSASPSRSASPRSRSA